MDADWCLQSDDIARPDLQVDLSATIKPMHPRKLSDTIFESNQALFESFLGFPKPLLVACNGPAVGASVTSATLSDVTQIRHQFRAFLTHVAAPHHPTRAA